MMDDLRWPTLWLLQGVNMTIVSRVNEQRNGRRISADCERALKEKSFSSLRTRGKRGARGEVQAMLGRGGEEGEEGVAGPGE